MSVEAFDVIVIGVGGMGSAACHELARRGRRVLGLEQFDLAHDRGSSHGLTRVIRRAYYEDPCYVPLVARSFDRWRSLEQATNLHLLTSCGCLNIGAPESDLITGVRRSAATHHLEVEELSAVEISRRFPPITCPPTIMGILERDAGFLAVERCVEAQVQAARKAGADIRAQTLVTGWAPEGHGVRVTTATGSFTADRLVLTAGPWAPHLLGQWGVPLRLMRQTMFWFGTADDEMYRPGRFPIYLVDSPQGCFYGLPVSDNNGHKVAQHYGAPELRTVAEIEREMRDDDAVPVRGFLKSFLPGVAGPLRRAQVCTYTLTPDRHFILDRHPEWPQVAIAAGFSGHGFKFAPVVGEILADLVLTGSTSHPIDRFRLDRFTSTSPA